MLPAASFLMCMTGMSHVSTLFAHVRASFTARARYIEVRCIQIQKWWRRINTEDIIGIKLNRNN